MNVQVGQVWEDTDSRRVGRTFKIANIDGDMATCENLTGAGGIAPTRPTAFINLKRFQPRYYKLRTNGNTTKPAFSLDMLKSPPPPVPPEILSPPDDLPVGHLDSTATLFGSPVSFSKIEEGRPKSFADHSTFV